MDRADVEGIIRDIKKLKELFPEPRTDMGGEEQGYGREMEEIESAPLAFYGAISRSMLLKCHRCAGCCIRNEHIALRPDDCRRMAAHLHMGLSGFMRLYTTKHSDKEQADKGAREIKRKKESLCPFLDELKLSCIIYQARPSICRSYPALTEEIIQSTVKGKLITYSKCPAAIEVSERIASFGIELLENKEAEAYARAFFSSHDAAPFFVMLYLKALEMIFGQEAALRKGNRLGLVETIADEDLSAAALLFAGLLSPPNTPSEDEEKIEVSKAVF